MKIVLNVASEGLPFIKSGGLADVIGSLPKSLNTKRWKTIVVLPLYKKIKNNYTDLKKIKEFPVKAGKIDTTASLYSCQVGEVDYYFIGEDRYFNRDSMYGYADDGERFAFYCAAVFEMLDFLPKLPDVIHCHDWHTGMIPLLGKQGYKRTKIKYVFTIHNLQFQGDYPLDMMQYFKLDDKAYQDGSIRFENGISYMKAGINYADKVTTVSDTYAKEILTREYGERMDSVLSARQKDLVGIVNGIDTDLWNPATDKNLCANYSKGKPANKKKCKMAVQKRLGLRVSKDVMLVAMISRMTWQKGASIILERMSQIMGQDIQLVILGNGDNYIENELRKIEANYPHRAVFYCGYNEELSHEIYAGADLFLMPSLFEPCGISQLISMRYGTIPLVREIGGLKDTVQPYNQNDGSGDGFSFKNFSGDDLIFILKYAIEVFYYRPNDWMKLMKNAMKKDVSWKQSAGNYEAVYRELLKK